MTSILNANYDRLKEVKQFDESKIGVKGLLDSGATTIPRFFHYPSENLPGLKPKNRPHITVPVIDFSGERSTITEEIRRASSTLGFFPIVNHGIPKTVIDSAINGMKRFFEGSTEYKMQFYHIEAGKGVGYSTNIDLYQSKAASWRDTLEMMSNDEYKSVEHRVLANPIEGARVSIAVFFVPSNREKLYGPFPELISTEKPMVFKEFVYVDYMREFYTKELGGKTLPYFYRIDNTTD